MKKAERDNARQGGKSTEYGGLEQSRFCPEARDQ